MVPYPQNLVMLDGWTRATTVASSTCSSSFSPAVAFLATKSSVDCHVYGRPRLDQDSIADLSSGCATVRREGESDDGDQIVYSKTATGHQDR